MKPTQLTNYSLILRRSPAAMLAAAVLGCTGFLFVQCRPQGDNFNVRDGELDDDGFEVEVLPGKLPEPELSGPEGFKRLVDTLDPSLARDSDSSRQLPRARQVAIDPDFCLDLSYGQCLTLIIQVPASHLQIDPGLSSLNLMQSAPTYQGLLDKACAEGLAVGAPNLARQGPGRYRILGQVTRTRCVFQTLTDETTALPELSANEIGFGVRLIELALSSKQTSSTPAFGTIAFERNRMELNFHDAKVFAQGRWHHVRGAMNFWNMLNYTGIFGTARTGIRFDQALTFTFDARGTEAYLSTVLEPILKAAQNGEGLVNVAAEILVIRHAARALATGSNPVIPSLILIGVAADAIRDLCEHEASSCSIKGQNTNVRDAFLTTLGEASVVPSETRAVLFDGLKHIPFAVLKGILEHANLNELESSLDLPTKPIWVAR